jgi:adenosine kinase
MKVILTGSIAFDYLMYFPGYFKDHILPESLDKISLSFLVEDMVKRYGGVGANIAYNLALVGGKPYLYTAAGQDFGDFKRHLEAAGVDTSGVYIDKEKFTASFFQNTDLGQSQIASFYTGAMADSANMSLRKADHEVGDLVMVSPTDPRAMSLYIDECAELGLKMIFDPGQQIVRMDKSMMCRGVENAFGLFVNEYEFELLQKQACMSAEEILHSPEFCVVTLGKEGARVVNAQEDTLVPVIPDVKVVDPTGVGDAFRGGFLRGYLLGWPMKICAEMGATTAAYCLAEHGTQEHSFTWKAFKNYFRQTFDDQGLLDTINQDKE